MRYDSSVYCFLVPAPATSFSLRFGKQSWNVVAGAGTRLLFFYWEYFGHLLSYNERSEISQWECVLWDAHLMKYCVQSKICVYFTHHDVLQIIWLWLSYTLWKQVMRTTVIEWCTVIWSQFVFNFFVTDER